MNGEGGGGMARWRVKGGWEKRGSERCRGGGRRWAREGG